jgi:aerobic-type carbon monoxide dehydrogenase small subunit (CoxS/CutS family)
VLVDGQPIRACLTTVGAVAGGSILTIEGLARDGDLHPVQHAFIDQSAMQCGYCTPGFVMAAVGLLQREPSPSRQQVREALAEHLCRCGVYQRIERAILLAAEMSRGFAGGMRTK